MKFRIKALDNTKKELEIIENFYRTKNLEDFHIFESVVSSHTRVINWRKGLIDYVVSIDYGHKLIAKVTQPGPEWFPFDRDELKLFDSLDYDLHFLFKKATKQDIADWIGM
jgi:hypothetical protein